VKTKGKREFIAPVAGNGRVLAAFLAIALSASAMGRAQSKPAETSPAAAALNPATQALPEAHAGPAAPGEQQPRRGHEGITVHGHWAIEVRNPDGKLVSHREFENGLDYGAVQLSALLGRTATAGSWMVELADPKQAYFINIAEANSMASGDCTRIQNLNSNKYSCSTTPLTIVAPELINGAFSVQNLTLEGSGIVPKNFPASIGAVYTSNFACISSSSPTACFDGASTLELGGGNLAFTFRQLNGAAGTSTAPVDVIPGQTVSVKVVISFASGS
jgi:membrane-bound inhibitor of C-type lysozyme